jgi:hypothetical protein
MKIPQGDSCGYEGRFVHGRERLPAYRQTGVPYSSKLSLTLNPECAKKATI